MASITDIANMAVGHVGDDTVLVNIIPPNVDRSAVAGHCARYYAIARRQLIEMFPWRFATLRVQLSETDNLSTVWGYAYTLPSDSIHVVKVLSGGSFQPTDSLYSEQGGSQFDIQNGVLYTNEPEAWLLYRRDVTDPTKFTPSFVIALSYTLASFIAGPIVRGTEGIKLGQSLRDTGIALGRVGATLDANTTQEGDAMDFTPGGIAARGGVDTERSSYRTSL